MKKLFLLQTLRLLFAVILLVMALLILVYLLEVGFDLQYAPTNFVETVLATVFLIPVFFVLMELLSFVRTKMDESKQADKI
ncbi:MAG: hypothetical protein KGO81_07925 [Bacteroidota bacterium]|nr:hypothetical protein [Bacteroidota bacterium]